MSDLSAEEREILKAFEEGRLQRVPEPGRDELVQAAKATFKKNKRVNIRLSGVDLELIQERAAIEGIPYQTLMSSVLHKFVNGRLVDRGG